MGIEDIILIVVLVAIIGGAVAYIVKAKKKGVKCIGCPAAKTCGGKCKGDLVDPSGQRTAP